MSDNRVTDLQEDIARYEQKLQDTQAKLAGVRTDIEREQDNLKREQDEFTRFSESISTLIAKKQELESEVIVMTANLKTLNDSLEALKLEEDGINTRHNSNIARLQSEIDAMTEKHRISMAGIQSELDALELQLVSKRSQLAGFTEKETAIVSRISDLEKEATEKQEKTEQINLALLKLEANLAAAYQKSAEIVLSLQADEKDVRDMVQSAKKELLSVNEQIDIKKEELNVLVQSASTISDRERALDDKENKLRDFYQKANIPYPN